LVIDELVPVIRGKFGATQSVSIWNLVVGDVILLDTGAKIPADCIVVESSDLMVQEPTG
jgi:Ca2+-transporting ATPase